MVTCSVCQEGFEPAHTQRDHRVPRSWGGSDLSANKQILCIECHQQKTKLETSLLRPYVSDYQISAWFEYAFQNNEALISSFIREFEMKTCHFREVSAKIARRTARVEISGNLFSALERQNR